MSSSEESAVAAPAAVAATTAAASPLTVTVEFGGGLELLFGGSKLLPSLALPADVTRLRELVRWLSAHRLTERPDLFAAGDAVRPGILVLVNDVDWELEGGGAYALHQGDVIAFISTLHGG